MRDFVRVEIVNCNTRDC